MTFSDYLTSITPADQHSEW